MRSPQISPDLGFSVVLLWEILCCKSWFIDCCSFAIVLISPIYGHKTFCPVIRKKTWHPCTSTLYFKTLKPGAGCNKRYRYIATSKNWVVAIQRRPLCVREIIVSISARAHSAPALYCDNAMLQHQTLQSSDSIWYTRPQLILNSTKTALNET